MIDAKTPLSGREVAQAVLLDGAHRAQLIGYACTHFGLPREDVEDLLQETALELLRQRSRIHSPEGFVFTVFRARCARFLRSRYKRREVFSDTSGPTPERLTGEFGAPLDQVVALREALGTVSATCRRLLAAYYVEGQSLRDAASAVALAASSVTKTMSRCLRRLKECLA